MFKSIVVALDGSQHSGGALDNACDLAAKYGARLTLAHVLLRYASIGDVHDFAERNGFHSEIEPELKSISIAPVVVSPMGAAAASIVVPAEVLQKAGECYLAKAKEIAKKADVSEVTQRLIDGSPASAILDCAAEEDADLIVLGSRGFGDVKSLILGSVSHKVVQEAKAPCLIVK
jgi:nucleotide-binding universal stress UspA family protein